MSAKPEKFIKSTTSADSMAKQGLGQPFNDRRAYSINEYCSMFGICRSTYYKQVLSGEIKPIKILSRTLIPAAQIDLLVRGGRK